MDIPYAFKKCTKCGKWLVASKVNFNKAKKGKHGLRSDCKQCQKEYNKQNHEQNKEARKEYNKQWRELNKEHVKEYNRKYNKQYREQNKEYIKEYTKQYYKQNQEYHKEYAKQYREGNKELCKIRCKQWRENNKEHNKELNKQWRELNKEYRKEYGKQYREENQEHIKEYNKQYHQSPQGQVSQFNRKCRRRTREQNQGNGIITEQWLECMKFFEFRCAYSGQKLSKGTRSLDHIKPVSKGGEHDIWNLVPMDRILNCSKRDKDLLEWYQEQDFFSEERLQKIYEWQEYAYEKWGKAFSIVNNKTI